MSKPHYLKKKKTGPPGPRKEHGVKTKRKKKIKMMDAYYSSKMAEAVGHAIYLNLEGEPIAVTEVVSEGNKPVCGAWGDLKYIGKVSKFVDSFPVDPYEDYGFRKQDREPDHF